MRDNENDRRKIKGLNFCLCVITILLIIWFGVGNYFTFSIYDRWVREGKLSCSAGEASNLCCDAVPLYFSYVFIWLVYLVPPTVAVCVYTFVCFLFICMALIRRY